MVVHEHMMMMMRMTIMFMVKIMSMLMTMIMIMIMNVIMLIMVNMMIMTVKLSFASGLSSSCWRRGSAKLVPSSCCLVMERRQS